MGALRITVKDARRQPIDDKMDVTVISARTDAAVGRALAVPGRSPVRFDNLADGEPCIVRVFPTRHRPVQQFAIPSASPKPTEVQLFTPLHPDRVRATFPDYSSVHADLRRVLEASSVEGVAGTGEALYAALNDLQKAGLFNLFAKMSTCAFDGQRNVWTFVDRLFRVRADRVFADVQPALRDHVKSAIASERFHEVSGSQHTPPATFAHAGSFKTSEHFGNLQLTFFSSANGPLQFKVDADIDDAAGLGHAFQVIRNAVTHGTTHPFDIHEILVFRQEVVLPYTLA